MDLITYHCLFTDRVYSQVSLYTRFTVRNEIKHESYNTIKSIATAIHVLQSSVWFDVPTGRFLTAPVAG